MQETEFVNSLEEEKISTDVILKNLQDLVDNYLTLKNDIELLEEELKNKKKSFNKIAMEEIPIYLAQYNLSEIKLATGQKVIVKEDISITIKDNEKFFTFLKNRNEQDLIKTQISFDRMDDAAFNSLFHFLMEYDYAYDIKKDVHAQTRKKYFKELLGIGKEDYKEGIKKGKYLRAKDIEAFASAYNFYKTKIK